ncbi:putative RNA methyltransferase [Neobacillus rhizosphaerae]|uniref:RNA methyltransferase n=1 Tax=Neobacillus rhizosphaerae TaxID=2880965 RepID=A0ABN8KQJ6_9BACI|nr:hypothetical protein [Neobacillus rhizosphaerae]CAH2714786.1 putative RNA methyltransferase [Neobacillus rhizosphaerae]
MATYKQIQEYIKQKHGYSVKTCWIAHMKEVCGLNPKRSQNRHSPNARVHPCPPGKQNELRQAFEHFKMI